MNLFQRQIVTTHAELIRLAIAMREDRDLAPVLFGLLHELEEAGWRDLVKGVIDFVEGRDIDLHGLDAEDEAILIAIQRGYADKEFLSQLELDAAQAAAPALAALIYAATQGEREALDTLAELRGAADTPVSVATSDALIAIVEGMRDADTLTKRLPAEQQRLIQTVLQKLAELEA